MTDKTDREIMQQALNDLEALVAYIKGGEPDLFMQVPSIEALSERLTQPEQKQVACIVKGCRNHRGEGLFIGELCSPCHTFITTGEGKHSQAYRNSQREWQGLTNEEVGALTVFDGLHHVEIPILANFVWAVEAKLKEKNT